MHKFFLSCTVKQKQEVSGHWGQKEWTRRDEPPLVHFWSQHSSLVVRSPGGCLLFFHLRRSTQGGVQFPGCRSSHSTSFGLLRLFVTLISKVSCSSTEHAEVVVEAPFSLIGGELTIHPQLGSEVWPCGTRCGFVGQLGGARRAGR